MLRDLSVFLRRACVVGFGSRIISRIEVIGRMDRCNYKVICSHMLRAEIDSHDQSCPRRLCRIWSICLHSQHVSLLRTQWGVFILFPNQKIPVHEEGLIKLCMLLHPPPTSISQVRISSLVFSNPNIPSHFQIRFVKHCSLFVFLMRSNVVVVVIVIAFTIAGHFCFILP